ncbi:MAG: hypothetical protein A3F72_09985 [Bacteroidetes bacterium RIFCSPLOWO2_12_FULL_35_15]|nr:MAG: hypothetical protein A3F72_09985 [Bacteroidetes bacterium RIFCSPLOWO2_12_FULL_35_15]
MFEILKSFETKYGYLKKKGLTIEGLAMVDVKKKKHVIKISRPLVFDNRLLPKRFEGLDVKTNIKLSTEMPKEFNVDRTQPDWHKKQYIWAPERFVKYVERCEKEIKAQLNNPQMTKPEILDALCFGNFEEHKLKSLQLVKEGKLPAYHEN